MKLVLLVAGLLLLALGLFIQWPGWWDALFAVLGGGCLLAWGLIRLREPGGRPPSLQHADRRYSLVDRRVVATPVARERRFGARRSGVSRA